MFNTCMCTSTLLYTCNYVLYLDLLQTRGHGLARRMLYRLCVPCGYTICLRLSLSPESPATSCAFLLPDSHLPVPAPEPAPEPAYPATHPPLFSLVSLTYCCLRPCCLSQLPLISWSASPAGYLCPGLPILPLWRVLLPSSPLLLPLPTRTSPITSAAWKASKRVPRARALSLAWPHHSHEWHSVAPRRQSSL